MRINADSFFHPAPIDYDTWNEHRTRRPRKRIVRIAWKGAGWHSLEGVEKPIWVVLQEIHDQAMRNFAEKYLK